MLKCNCVSKEDTDSIICLYAYTLDDDIGGLSQSKEDTLLTKTL